MTVEAFWQAFLSETGRPENTRYLEAFHFDLTERPANELLRLVLRGKKRATASSLLAYDPDKGERPPRAGDLSVVTDFAGEPHCVIETTAVTVLPFGDMTWELCSREGEDMTLASWQAAHTRFFTEEGKRLGYAFSPDMPVVFEDFRVVYPKASL